MIIESELSKEEANLYNPAYVGVILYQAIRECSKQNQQGLHCSLLYLIAPLSLSGCYSSVLPATVSTPLAGWAADFEGHLVGFANSVSAYIDVVNMAIVFLLEKEAISLSENGFFLINNETLPKLPAMVNKNEAFKRAFLGAGFLGRWFGQSPSVEAIYTHLGVMP
ncbi:three component ABC system middle component [Shewanella algae]|uniref:three component ABC system middle component n=1 Tax=Shewanella algae TaxID=38313 RepID=UPI001AAD0658|nr:three component ABC system middle component [Shewanella algae]MBO2566039.1 hypothetical protein [Shewanella algae]